MKMCESKEKINTRKKYKYDYPEQRLLCEGLQADDVKLIADKLGYSERHVYYFTTGERRMPDRARVLIEKLSIINRAKEKISA